MTRKKRGVLIAGAVLATLGAAEVAFHRWKGPEACVRVENLGPEPIDGLVVTSGTGRWVVPRVNPGAQARVFVTGRGPGTLALAFRQRGNGITAYELPGFDAGLMAGEGAQLVLQIKPNEVIRYQEGSDPTTPAGGFARRLWKQTWDSLTAVE